MTTFFPVSSVANGPPLSPAGTLWLLMQGAQFLITEDKFYTTDVSEWAQNSCSGIKSNVNVLSSGDGGETFLNVGKCDTALLRAHTYCSNFIFRLSQQKTK